MKKIKVDMEKLYGAMRGRMGEFSEKYNVHRNTVSNKLNGRVKMNFDDLNNFAEFLGRNARDFLEESGEVAA